MPHCCVSVFPVSVSCSRLDLQPAGGEAASAASLALPAVPRSQWNCPKDQTRCRSGEQHLASPKPFIFTFLFMTKQMRYNCQLLRGVMCWNYFLVVHHLCSAPWRLAVTVRLLALVLETKSNLFSSTISGNLGYSLRCCTKVLGEWMHCYLSRKCLHI